jgi:nucleotide-binding universal stress UspA family protein
MAIAWKASEPAARAVTAAVPWLRRAERVSVLTVGEHPAFDEIQNLLDGHGIAGQPLAIGCGDLSVGERLLREAQAIGADCLVMGAYHHHPLGEMLFGGVTRHILRWASVPVFMMH